MDEAEFTDEERLKFLKYLEEIEQEPKLEKVKKEETVAIRPEIPGVPSLVHKVRQYNARIGLPYKTTDQAELRELQKLERKGFLTYNDGYVANQKI
jgi:hypothetical protein